MVSLMSCEVMLQTAITSNGRCTGMSAGWLEEKTGPDC